MKLTASFGLFTFAAFLEFAPLAQAIELTPKRVNQTGSIYKQQFHPTVTNKVNPLVIMIRFADHTARKLPTKNQLPSNMKVHGWITLPQSEAYYASANTDGTALRLALNDVLSQVDAQVNLNRYDSDNDGQIDNITFLHSGFQDIIYFANLTLFLPKLL